MISPWKESALNKYGDSLVQKRAELKVCSLEDDLEEEIQLISD
jgi:hypothetical protein